jgi:hypothetical protein
MVRAILLTATALALVIAAASSAGSSAPVLHVSSLAPFTVTGTRFQASERVRVLLGEAAPRVVRVRATARGTFVATFTGVSVQRCDGYVVRASGSRGSTAVVRTRSLSCASTNPG